jgi:hypothetical protein
MENCILKREVEVVWFGGKNENIVSREGNNLEDWVYRMKSDRRRRSEVVEKFGGGGKLMR